MRILTLSVLLLILSLASPAFAYCEVEKAEYEKALEEYQANKNIETQNALSSAYKRYMECVSSAPASDSDSTFSTSSSDSGEAIGDCSKEEEEYYKAFNEYQSNLDPDKWEEKHTAMEEAYQAYQNCLHGSKPSQTYSQSSPTPSQTSPQPLKPPSTPETAQTPQSQEYTDFIKRLSQSLKDMTERGATEGVVVDPNGVERRIKIEGETLLIEDDSGNYVEISVFLNNAKSGELRQPQYTKPERISDSRDLRIKDNLVVISRPADEVIGDKIIEVMDELEKELESYEGRSQESDLMDRVLVALEKSMEREEKIRELIENRDDESQKVVDEVMSQALNNASEEEKSLVEELMYLALEKGKEKAMDKTKEYLKNELKKRGYKKLVSGVEKFENINNKVNDYLSKAIEVKEIKDEIDGISKLHKDGKITKEDSRILKAAVGLKKAVSWITSKIPIIGNTMSEVYEKSLDAGIKTGVMMAKHKKDINDLIDCLEKNTC